MSAIPLSDLAARLAGPLPPPAFSARTRKGFEVAAVAGYKRHFAEQRSPDGTPWPKLKYPRPRGGDMALIDTGRLRNSGVAEARGDEVVLSAAGPGAEAHQFGATIRPVRAKALAIPVSPMAKRFGSPRRFPGPPLVYLPSRKHDPEDRGKLAQITFRGRGKRSRVVVTVHYLLKSKTVIDPRPFVGFSRETLDVMLELAAGDAAAQAAARAGG